MKLTSIDISKQVVKINAIAIATCVKSDEIDGTGAIIMLVGCPNEWSECN